MLRVKFKNPEETVEKAILIHFGRVRNLFQAWASIYIGTL